MKDSTVSDRNRLGNSSMWGAARIRPEPGGIRDHIAPRDDGRLQTDSQEGQRSLQGNEYAKVDGGNNDHRGDRIRQDVGGDDPQGRGTQRPRGLNVVVRLDLQHAGAHEPGDRWPGKDRDDESDLAYGDREGSVDLIGERVEEQDSTEEYRDRQEDLGNPPDHRVEPAAAVSGNDPYRGSEDQAEQPWPECQR